MLRHREPAPLSFRNMKPGMLAACVLAVLCALGPAATGAQLSVPKPALSTAPLSVPHKTLHGPGPSSAHPRTLLTGALPMLGHMHGEFSAILSDIGDWLRYAFQTSNNFTMAVSGTGHAGMEAAIANVVEPGDQILVGVNGIWGERVADLVERYGGVAHQLLAEPGTVFTLSQLEAAFQKHPGAKGLFLTHGESSTGTLQPVDGVGALCKKHGAIFILDTVCTLGGVPLHLDAAGIDVTYSGSQKCLGAPPGSAPFSMSQRARDKLAARKTKVASYYFDATLFGANWGVDGKPRWYHHTSPVNSMYQLREALAMLAEEGLEATWQRHQEAAAQLYAGLERLGLTLFVKDPAARLPTVTTVEVPPGVVWSDVTTFLMTKYKLEISGGLGPSAGKVWRIGLMGHGARPGDVAFILAALEDALRHVGFLKGNAPGGSHGAEL